MNVAPARRILMTALLACSACGGGGGGAPSSPDAPTGGTATATFSGTSRYSETGGCSSTSRHDLSAGEGTIAVTLVQASASSVRLQLCHPTAANHNTDCTIPPFVTLALGGTTSAPLRGGRSQSVTVFPDACGRPGTFPSAEVSYTVTVTHPR